jgi:hypothetical protein
MRAFDPHAAVRRLATPQGTPPSDQLDSDVLLGEWVSGTPTRAWALASIGYVLTVAGQAPTRSRSASRAGRPAARIFVWTASMS